MRLLLRIAITGVFFVLAVSRVKRFLRITSFVAVLFILTALRDVL